MKDVDHSRIAAAAAIGAFNPVVDDGPIRIAELVVALQHTVIGKIEIGQGGEATVIS